MAKKVKLSIKINKEEVCEKSQKNLCNRFLIRCNLSHQEITEKIFSHCFVCKNFDELWDFKKMGSKFDSHSSDHLCELNIPNHIPLFSFDWNTKEEEKLLNIIKITGGQDWEKISEGMGKKNLIECESNFFHSYLRKNAFPFFSRKRLFNFSKRFQTVDLLSKLIKIWIAIFDKKCNWIPQRGENFFEWENEVEEILEKKKPKSGENFEKHVFTDIEMLFLYNKKLYERELYKEFFGRNELHFKKNHLKLNFSSKIYGSLTRLEQSSLLRRFKDIELGKIKNSGKTGVSAFFSTWLKLFPFLRIKTSQKIFIYFRKIYLNQAYKKNKQTITKRMFEKKNVKSISKWMFTSEKERLLSEYIGIYPRQLLFFKILVLFKKKFPDGSGIHDLLLCEKASFFFFIGEILKNFYGLRFYSKKKQTK